MSLESMQRKAKHGELTIEVVLSGLKHALKGKFEQNKINEAIGELSSEKAWFESRKAELKTPEDLLKLEWTGVLFGAGLPMSEEEAKIVVTSAVQSIRPEHNESFSSEDALEPSGSNMNLVGDEDFMKAVEALKSAETVSLSDTASREVLLSEELSARIESHHSQHQHQK